MKNDQLQLRDIHEFLRLQRCLLHAMTLQFDREMRSPFILDVPKRGTVEACDGIWEFTKHGVGMRFRRTSDSIVIDVPRDVDAACIFDAHRLSQFLESSWHVEISESQVEHELLRMVDSREIATSDTGVRPKCFHLVSANVKQQTS